MFKFLRRVFIILVLLIIIFVIFRIAKPDATSRFVDKVKSIPTTISSRFHREKDPEIIINGKSNKDLISNDNNETLDNSSEEIEKDENNNKEKSSGDINELTRLEDLNNEIESIIQENKTGSNGGNDTTNTVPETNNTVSETNNTGTNNTQTNNTQTNNNQVSEQTNNESTNLIIQEITNLVGDVEQPEKKETTKPEATQSNNSQTNTNPSKILTQEQRGECAKAGLSVRDCEDLVTDLGNFN